MLLRVRVTLPDRPGALGQVARTLGVAGADIVQVVVLERLGGRAVDDFTVVWPGASRVERLLAGLAAIPGVQVDGVWKAIGAPVSGGHDAELLAQVAANPGDGLATLVDAVPGLLAADWAAAAVVPADWAARTAAPRATRADEPSLRLPTGSEPTVAYASWRAPSPLRLPEVTPLRARPLTGTDGTRYAVAPFGRAGLVLVIARTDDDDLPAAAFHITEVDRIAQLVRAAAVILGDRLDRAGVPPVASAVTDPS
ncbi:amino acid-binding protein [Couchioplanes caeruleus]|uniref:amino acid-binding protein n=1 Tax=Couchioplanes caeruleus TaxID=56438 RepID=UPI0020BE1DAE|nr:amino acid-binding protein [Couchioplanes caeruleus]UQU66445.1 amino acid-binding protein [Couchioplanes caeruleus]